MGLKKVISGFVQVPAGGGGGSFDPTAPGPIGGTTPGEGHFTALTSYLGGDTMLETSNTSDGMLILRATGPHSQEMRFYPRESTTGEPTLSTPGGGVLTITSGVKTAATITASNTITSGANVMAGGGHGWTSGELIYKYASNDIGVSNGANPVSLTAYHFVTDASNYRRGGLSWDGTNLRVGPQGAGLGASCSMEVFSLNDLYLYSESTLRWYITGGSLFPNGNNTYKIGDSTHELSQIWLRGGLILAAGQASFSGSTFGTFLFEDGGGAPGSCRLQIGGTTSSFPSLKRSTTNLEVKLADDSAYSSLVASALKTNIANTDSTNTSGSGSAIMLTNSNGVGQNVVYSEINGTMCGKWRTDYAGNLSWISNAGAHYFLVGGDYGVGKIAMAIQNNGGGAGGTCHLGTDITPGTFAGASLSASTSHVKVTGSLAINFATATHTLDVRNSVTNALIRMQNNSVTGWSAFDFYSSAGAAMGGFGYANASASFQAGKMYAFSNDADMVFSAGSNASARTLTFFTANVLRLTIGATGQADFGGNIGSSGRIECSSYINAGQSLGDNVIYFYFGAGTNTRPALKRTGAAVQWRLGDDSDFAGAQTLYDRYGSGTPEGSVTAPVGASYHRTDGGAGTSLYVKESGAGNTGWVAK